MATPDGIYYPGAVVDVTKEEAAELIKGGYAEAVEQPTKKPRKKKGE